MKHLLSIGAFTLLLFLFSCNGKNKDSDIVYEYVEEVPELSKFLQDKIGSWAEEGKVCYGLLAMIDDKGIIQNGAVIKAKIIRINGDSLKMKSLSNLSLGEAQGCDKMGISKGQTWWETEGEIFLEEEKASAYLAEKLEKVIE